MNEKIFEIRLTERQLKTVRDALENNALEYQYGWPIVYKEYYSQLMIQLGCEETYLPIKNKL